MPLVVGTGLLTSAVFLTIVMFAISARRRRVEVGSEALVGRMGVAKTELAPTGMVQVGGELWSAQVEDRSAALRAGQDVEVIGVDGLRLRVRARDS